MNIKELENQIIIIINETDKALKLLGVIRNSKAKPITQATYKIKILCDEYYQYCRIEKLKSIAMKSNHAEYPYQIINESGYVCLYSSNFKKIKLEHRYIMEKAIGRALNKDEIVHHINKNPSNNNIENLKIVDKSEHREMHTSK